MDAIAQLRAENVVDQAVLGDSGHALKCGSRDDCVEVVTVAGDLRDGAGNPGLDP